MIEKEINEDKIFAIEKLLLRILPFCENNVKKNFYNFLQQKIVYNTSDQTDRHFINWPPAFQPFIKSHVDGFNILDLAILMLFSVLGGSPM
jgi:hypothetical protein